MVTSDLHVDSKQHAIDQKIFQSFDSFDRDKFGFISVNDLKLALESCGVELSQDETYW
jgi:Ca2+-binding EF-hand superfamily protein